MQKVTQDTTSQIFWVDLEQDHKAKVVYKLDGQEMHITSTLIPEDVRGRLWQSDDGSRLAGD